MEIEEHGGNAAHRQHLEGAERQARLRAGCGKGDAVGGPPGVSGLDGVVYSSWQDPPECHSGGRTGVRERDGLRAYLQLSLQSN